MAPAAKRQKTSAAATPAQPTAISGDSLEEDFLLEPSFAPSDDDDAGSDVQPDVDAVYESGSEVEGVAPAASSSKPDGKRKLKGNGPASTPSAAASSKKEKSKAAKAEKVKEAMEATLSLGLLPSEALADRLAEKQSAALPKLSSIEKDDLRISESMILDTSHVEDRSSLFSFIRASVATLPATLAKPPKKPGSPRVLVVAAAALRVADLCREVKPYKTKDIDVAKLFAKHFKISEHVEYLNKTKCGIAVGTPNRIGKLLSETDALQLTHLSHLVLDVSHHNTKKQSLLDMYECREDLFKLVLGNKDVMQRLRDGRMQIVFF